MPHPPSPSSSQTPPKPPSALSNKRTVTTPTNQPIQRQATEKWKQLTLALCFPSTDTYVDVLDGSRVHPEAYEWARKMAVDALEYDDTAEDANPAGALEEILESPERLKDLDLDAFAEELKRQVR